MLDFILEPDLEEGPFMLLIDVALFEPILGAFLTEVYFWADGFLAEVVGPSTPNTWIVSLSYGVMGALCTEVLYVLEVMPCIV